MKIILTGSTGFIGSTVLHQCLSHPSITSIIVLSRRALPSSVTSHPKLTVILMSSFTSYLPTLLTQLIGASACIWALGLPLSTHEVEVEFPLAAVNAFTTHLAPSLSGGARFRFVYLSALLAVKDQQKPLLFGQTLRRLKGETENNLLELGHTRSDRLETFIARPGAVLATNTHVPGILVGWSRSIRVDELAVVMVDMALNGGDVQVMESGDLRARGAALLSRKE